METIQCLTVAVMMAVMVYTAPTPVTKDDLLKDICDTAKNMSKMNTTPHWRVKKIGQEGGSTCVDNFFCLAEKSLKDATEKHPLQIEGPIQKLIHQLEMYNNKNGSTQCHLHTNIEYPLQKFLEDIRRCVNRLIGCEHQ